MGTMTYKEIINLILVIAGSTIAAFFGVIWNMLNQRINGVKNDVEQVRNELESTRVQTIESFREMRNNVNQQVSDLTQYARHEVRDINQSLRAILSLSQHHKDEDD